MPVLAADATRDDIASRCWKRGSIAAAIGYLRARGVTDRDRLAQLGATMVNAYLARPDALRIEAWAPVGMMVEFAREPEPVLDVIAEGFSEVAAAP